MAICVGRFCTCEGFFQPTKAVTELTNPGTELTNPETELTNLETELTNPETDTSTKGECYCHNNRHVLDVDDDEIKTACGTQYEERLAAWDEYIGTYDSECLKNIGCVTTQTPAQSISCHDHKYECKTGHYVVHHKATTIQQPLNSFTCTIVCSLFRSKDSIFGWGANTKDCLAKGGCKCGTPLTNPYSQSRNINVLVESEFKALHQCSKGNIKCVISVP